MVFLYLSVLARYDKYVFNAGLRIVSRGILRYVIALGGNALDGGNIAPAAKMIARLHKAGHEVAVTHGNGPQVGELATIESKSLAVLTAQTEAEIGLMIENSIPGAMESTATVITRSIVDPMDRAFRNPSKPIGKVLSTKEADSLRKKGTSVANTLNGPRRVVPSPIPARVLEASFIAALLKSGYIVICGGGGGVPVSVQGGALRYQDAVIDKDRASAVIAKELKADRLVILTTVDGAYVNYGRKSQRKVKRISSVELGVMLDEGEFEEGSMAPKVEACIDFVDSTGKPAVIGSLAKPEDAIRMSNVTVVTV